MGPATRSPTRTSARVTRCRSARTVRASRRSEGRGAGGLRDRPDPLDLGGHVAAR